MHSQTRTRDLLCRSQALCHHATPPRNTIGYIDPKYYVLLNVLTAKGDVYGLGVVLLELLTGKRAEFKNDEDCT